MRRECARQTNEAAEGWGSEAMDCRQNGDGTMDGWDRTSQGRRAGGVQGHQGGEGGPPGDQWRPRAQPRWVGASWLGWQAGRRIGGTCRGLSGDERDPTQRRRSSRIRGRFASPFFPTRCTFETRCALSSRRRRPMVARDEVPNEALGPINLAAQLAIAARPFVRVREGIQLIVNSSSWR